MPKARRRRAGTMPAAEAAVIRAKARAKGKQWSLLHRCESLIRSAAGAGGSGSHPKTKRKKRKKA